MDLVVLGMSGGTGCTPGAMDMVPDERHMA